MPTFREEFQESLYRMLGSLTGGGVSVLLTVEVTESFDKINFSPHSVSFLAQNIIFLRYAEIEGRLRKVIAVIKMRRSVHSQYLHAYDITSEGMRVAEPLTEYHGILTGVPARRAERGGTPGLTDQERAVLEALMASREATAERLAEVTGTAPRALSAALARLVGLNYVVEIEEEGRTLYRPAVRPLGA